MKGGHKPQTPAEKRARATFRPDRDGNRFEVVAPNALPQQPDWLTEAGRQEWLDCIGRVSTTRLATELDSALFATLCNLLGALALCWRSGDVPPAAHLVEARRLGELFGLAGPRSRVGVASADPKPNPFLKVRPKLDAP